MKYIVLATLLLSSIATADLTGAAQVTDGDTIKIGNTIIRLHGIDAPEKHQKCEKYGQTWACGRASTELLLSLINSQVIVCKGAIKDRYKRLIAVCYVDQTNLNAAMVDAGLALAYRKYSSDYVLNEEKAKVNGEGMWAGEFIYPWDWRRGKR